MPDGAIGTHTANATDLVDDTPAITHNSTGIFSLGDTVILYNATDTSGNLATANQNITVRDTTPPLIYNLINYTIPTTNSSGVIDHMMSHLQLIWYMV